MTEQSCSIATSEAPPIQYLVEVSRQPTPKSGYRVRYSLQSMGTARFWYNGINIGLGYKKRLVAVSSLWGKRVLARASS